MFNGWRQSIKSASTSLRATTRKKAKATMLLSSADPKRVQKRHDERSVVLLLHIAQFLMASLQLTDLMEYEKENNQSASLTAPSRALARILGRGGANIRELQEQTSAEIDVSRQQADDPSSSATVTIRGTKQAIASAKKAIQSIITEVQDEATYEIEVPRSLHVTIIGKGGSNSKLIAGGPAAS